MRTALALLLAVLPLRAADAPLPLRGTLSGEMIYGVRVTDDLVLWSDKDGTHVFDATNGIRRPTIDGILRDAAASSSGAMLLYEGSDSLRVATLDARGNVARETELDRRRTGGAIAVNGDRALVFAQGGDAFLLDSSGNVIRPSFRVTSQAFEPAVAAVGSGFVVAWSLDWSIFTARVARDGAVRDIRTLAAAQGGVTVASDGRSSLVLWHGDRDKLYGSLDGGTPFVVATTLGFQSRAFWNGRELVVRYEWLDAYDDRTPSVREARVGTNGAVRQIDNELAGASSFDASPTLTAWVARHPCAAGDALMLRVRDGPPAAVSTGEPHQISAALGSTFTVHAERSDRTRLYLGETLLSEEAARNTGPVVNEDGPHALVLWWDDRGDDCQRVLQAAIVSGDGSIRRRFTISHDVLGHQRPAVAWNGSAYAVVWERGSANQLLGATFDAEGNALTPPAAITESRPRGNYVTAIMYSPTLQWNGTSFVLVWHRHYSTDIPLYTDPPADYDVRRQSFAADLTPRGAAEVLERRGATPTWALGAEHGLIAWYARGTVQVRIVTRATGATVVQRGIDGSDGPLLSAPLGDDFVVVAGTLVHRVSGSGGATALEALPAGAIANDVRTASGTVSIAYVLGERAYVRTVSVDAPPGRRRAVRH